MLLYFVFFFGWDSVRAFFFARFLAICMTLRHLRHREEGEREIKSLLGEGSSERDRLGNAILRHIFYSLPVLLSVHP